MAGGGSAIGLRDAAEQLGVHYMTAYRYVRSGRLEAHKDGNEWKVRPHDLARLRSESDGATRGPVRPPRAAHRDRLERRLIVGDEVGAWGVIESALGSGAEPGQILTEMLAPSLRSIGQRWADGELSIADEHRASAVSQRLIARMGPQFSRRGRRKGSLVIGSVAGDNHSLPTAIMSDLLRGAGLDVVDLGADCPDESFIDAIASMDRPCAVGICVTAPEAVAAVPGAIHALRQAGVAIPVVVGGGAVGSAEQAAALGADNWAGGVDDFVALFVDLAARNRSTSRSRSSSGVGE